MDYLKRKFSWSEIESSQRLMLLIVIALSIYSFLFGERTPASNGFGWDGVIYGDLVRNIDKLISTEQLNNYYAHRSLPSFIVRTLLMFFDFPMTDANIIKTFAILNFVLFMVIFVTWKKIMTHFNLSLRGHWLGFCGLFMSFSMSKLVLYLPLVTDVAALCTGTLLLYFYLKRKPLLILVTSVIGAFCWPGVAISGAILLLFLNFELSSKSILADSNSAIVKESDLKILMKWGWIGIACCVVLRLIFKLISPGWNFGALFTGLPTIYFLALGLVLLLGSRALIPELWKLRSQISWKLFIFALTAVILPSYLGKLISNPALHNPNNPLDLLRLLLFPPDNKFFLPPMTLAVFWGPAFLFMIVFWKQIAKQIRKLGPGPMAVIAIHLPLGLGCEPRFYTLIWPFLLISFLMAFEKFVFAQNFKKIFIILTVAFSQFWLPINCMPWSPELYGDLLRFPKQFLFMHLGLWTSWPMYMLQLPLVIFCGYLLRKSVVEIRN